MIKLEGSDELLKAINQITVNTEKATDAAVLKIAHRVQASAVKSIQEKSAGRVVMRKSQSGKRKKHTASKAGDAPNTDTGNLVRSIKVEHKKGSGEAAVGTNVKYGAYLEFGGRNPDSGSEEYARPWLQPALEKHENELTDEIIKEFNKK